MLKKITKWETEDGTVFDTQEEAEDYMFEQDKEVMVHTTEQERAEFEAHFKHLDLTQEPDAWGVPRYKHDAVSLAWEAWQASRSAPAVPVPQSIEQMAVDRYKVVPSHSSMFYPCAVVAGDGQQQLYIGREAECQNMSRKFTGAFLDGAFVALAAAPQPSEATVDHSLTVEASPVQMPEPAAVVVAIDRKVFADGVLRVSSASISFCDLEKVDLGSNLYTEQQVVSLLKSQGISVKTSK